MSSLVVQRDTTEVISPLEPVHTSNRIAVFINIIAVVIIIAGIIAGIYQSQELYDGFQFFKEVTYSLPAISLGLILVGIAEIIALLHRHLAIKTGYKDTYATEATRTTEDIADDLII